MNKGGTRAVNRRRAKYLWLYEPPNHVRVCAFEFSALWVTGHVSQGQLPRAPELPTGRRRRETGGGGGAGAPGGGPRAPPRAPRPAPPRPPRPPPGGGGARGGGGRREPAAGRGPKRERGRPA